jgi:hypothetical protein
LFASKLPKVSVLVLNQQFSYLKFNEWILTIFKSRFPEYEYANFWTEMTDRNKAKKVFVIVA